MIVARRILLAAAFAGVLSFDSGGAAALAQDKAPRSVVLPNAILLARSWDAAIEEATIRNVPILFTTAMAT